MSAHAQRLKLRLFVEGVEVPVVAAQVVSSPNAPVMASIQIPPLAEALRFLPRSLVHLFFLDPYAEQNPHVGATGGSDRRNPGPSAFEQQTVRAEGADGETTEAFSRDFENQRYRLLFLGELVGFGWTKNASNRSIVLQCQDPSIYWDQAQQFDNTDIFGPGLKAMFSGGSTNLFTDFLSSPGEQVTKILQTPSARYPGLRGLLGGIVHLLEAIGGSYYGDKKFAGQNIFFSVAELRLHITQMITAYDKDPTAKRLLGGSFDSLFGRSIGNLGSQASFRKVINALMGVIFHETYGQPCPFFTPGTNGTTSGFARKRVRDMPAFGPIAASAESTAAALADMVAEVQGGSPDRADLAARLAAVQRSCAQAAAAARQQAPLAKRSGVQGVAALAEQLARAFKTAGTKAGQAASKLRSSAGAASGLGQAQVAALLAAASDELQKAGKLEANVTPTKSALPAQLKQQVFRPDVWFSAPPRCNVLFPDHYYTASFARSFMQEPTRLLLKTNDEFFGEDELFDKFYFAPKAITTKSQSNQLQALLRGDILDHELYTGILPVFEKMGEFNIFAARSGMVDGQKAKVGLAQRSANFLYFKYRFAARQMQVSARFNPYVACGFPGLVISSHVPLETVKLHNDLLKALGVDAKREVDAMLGAHFLCSFTEVTHSVSQADGSTSINCSYAREASESVEFLGAVQDEVRVLQKQPGRPAARTTTVAALFAPRVGGSGPNGGRVTEVRDVTDRYRASDPGDAQKLPLFGGKRSAGQPLTRVAVGFDLLAAAYGKEVADAVGDPNLVVSFRAFDVAEEVARQKLVKVDLPPEEVIRPGWYGDCWHPAKISDVYYEFFGTGAITEPTMVDNPGGDPAAGTFASDDAQRTLAEAAEDDSPEGAARQQMLALTLTKEANIQQAVAYLVLLYSVARHGGFDVDQLLRSYTWRPIASMVDIFGTSDLALDESGEQVVSGVEGFHSRAVGPFENLFGLVAPEVQSVLGVKRGDATSARLDTRAEKQRAVLDYIAALRLSRGLLG